MLNNAVSFVDILYKYFHLSFSVESPSFQLIASHKFLFQVFSRLFLSLKGASGEYSVEEEAVSDAMISKTVVGPTIASYSFNNYLASEVKLFLHFASKWIILSEVHFKTEQVDQPIVENKERNEKKEQPLTERETILEKESESIRQDMPANDSKLDPEYINEDLEKQIVVQTRNSYYKQTYIGIAFGILSMAVILIVFIVVLILKKNRQRIFSKHSSKCFKLFLLIKTYPFLSQFSLVL